METAKANPTAASAAAIVITKNTITWPSTFPNECENVTKLKLTAFNISSMDIKRTIKLRLSKTPATPIMKRQAESTK